MGRPPIPRSDFGPRPEDLAGGTDDLSQSEKDILFDWEQKFKMKYKYVGDIVD